MAEHNAEVPFEFTGEVTVIRGDGTRIPLGNIFQSAAPKNPFKRWVWLFHIKAKQKFPRLYGFKKG